MTLDNIGPAALASIVAELQTEGWDVVVDPGAVPGLGVTPDLLGTRDGAALYVEVKKATGPPRQDQEKISEYARQHDSEFRLYVIPADLPTAPLLFVNAVLAAREVPPRSAQLRKQIESADDELRNDRVEHGLYLAYAATRRAMQAIESNLGPADSPGGWRVESFDDGAELVARGVIGQAESSLMRETRQFLEELSVLEIDRLPDPSPWKQRARFLFQQVSEVGDLVIRILTDVEPPEETP